MHWPGDACVGRGSDAAESGGKVADGERGGAGLELTSHSNVQIRNHLFIFIFIQYHLHLNCHGKTFPNFPPLQAPLLLLPPPASTYMPLHRQGIPLTHFCLEPCVHLG